MKLYRINCEYSIDISTLRYDCHHWTNIVLYLFCLSVLTDGAEYKEVDLKKAFDKMDVSLITGKVRKLGLADEESHQLVTDAVAVRDSMTLASVTGGCAIHNV